jgi:hypothetical protein
MTQEEKAKLYDELKVKAQELTEDGYIDKLALVDMFPELKESEGERIRKKLVQFFKEKDEEDFEEWVPKAKVLAWLEAQGEQKSADKVEPKFKVGDIIKPKCYNETHSIKAIGERYYVLDVDIKIPFRDEDDWELVEQKPADEVEPKFKAGDWVVYKGDICQIVKREEGCNKLVTVFGTEKEPVNERNLSTARLWNIKDAKDGDVLADKFGVILFRKIGNEKYADAVDYYCAGFETGGFIIQKGVSYWGLSKEEELRPTTLEQRVRFFDTMGNAGYAWDAEKKELKKIEQKPQSTWKPSDEQMKALDFYIKTYVDTEGCYGSEVLELYEQRKKLKED